MCGEGFELQRGRNYTEEVTVTLAGNGLNAETFGFVITSSLQFKSFSLAQSDFLQPFERGDPLMSGPGLLTLFCLYHFGSRGVKSNILQHFEARLAKKLLICNNCSTSNKLKQT